MMSDFKFAALYRYTPEVGVSKKVNLKFVLVGGTARANPT